VASQELKPATWFERNGSDPEWQAGLAREFVVFPERLVIEILLRPFCWKKRSQMTYRPHRRTLVCHVTRDGGEDSHVGNRDHSVSTPGSPRLQHAILQLEFSSPDFEPSYLRSGHSTRSVYGSLRIRLLIPKHREIATAATTAHFSNG
jgi:hypothetical protein